MENTKTDSVSNNSYPTKELVSIYKSFRKLDMLPAAIAIIGGLAPLFICKSAGLTKDSYLIAILAVGVAVGCVLGAMLMKRIKSAKIAVFEEDRMFSRFGPLVANIEQSKYDDDTPVLMEIIVKSHNGELADKDHENYVKAVAGIFRMINGRRSEKHKKPQKITIKKRVLDEFRALYPALQPEQSFSVNEGAAHV